MRQGLTPTHWRKFFVFPPPFPTLPKALFGATVRDSQAFTNGQRVRGRENFNLNDHLIPYPAHWTLPTQERVRCRCLLHGDVIKGRPPVGGEIAQKPNHWRTIRRKNTQPA